MTELSSKHFAEQTCFIKKKKAGDEGAPMKKTAVSFESQKMINDD